MIKGAPRAPLLFLLAFARKPARHVAALHTACERRLRERHLGLHRRRSAAIRLAARGSSALLGATAACRYSRSRFAVNNSLTPPKTIVIPSAAGSGQALSLFKPGALHVGIKRRQLNGSAQGWKMHRSLAALGMTPSFGKEPSESRHRRFPRDAN